MVLVIKATNMEEKIVELQSSTLLALRLAVHYKLSQQTGSCLCKHKEKEYVLRQGFYIGATALQCTLCPVIALLNVRQDKHQIICTKSPNI